MTASAARCAATGSTAHHQLRFLAQWECRLFAGVSTRRTLEANVSSAKPEGGEPFYMRAVDHVLEFLDSIRGTHAGVEENPHGAVITASMSPEVPWQHHPGWTA